MKEGIMIETENEAQSIMNFRDWLMYKESLILFKTETELKSAIEKLVAPNLQVKSEHDTPYLREK